MEHVSVGRSPETESCALPWYALRVKSNFERVVTLHLRHRGFEEYLPTYRSWQTRSDRRKEVERPLFPGYVFCRFSWQNRLPIVTIPGIVNVVRMGGAPQPVDEKELQAVQAVVASGSMVGPWPFMRVGQQVLIERGPLAGVEGILARLGTSYRIVVSVTLLGRSVAAEIDRMAVRPIPSRGEAAPNCTAAWAAPVCARGNPLIASASLSGSEGQVYASAASAHASRLIPDLRG